MNGVVAVATPGAVGPSSMGALAVGATVASCRPRSWGLLSRTTVLAVRLVMVVLVLACWAVLASHGPTGGVCSPVAVTAVVPASLVLVLPGRAAMA